MIAHLTDEELLARIRLKLASGELPWRTPEQIFGGASEGATCAACDEPIAAASCEIEVASADGRQRLYHPRCYNMLRALRDTGQAAN